MKVEKSLIKDVGDLSSHPDYRPGPVPRKGSKVDYVGQKDNHNAATRGYEIGNGEGGETGMPGKR